MKIGDEIWVHGFIDEIRLETCVIKNTGGYFGTVMSEICCNRPSSEEVVKIEVGDEVITTEMSYVKEKGVVVRVTEGDEYPYNILSSEGDTQWLKASQIKKTGRSYPQIVEMFDRLKEDKDAM